MIKFSRLAAPLLAACLLLSACFTSEKPLFDPTAGAHILGEGRVLVTVHEQNAEKPEGGVLTLTDVGYVDETDENKASVSFHRLSGASKGWYIAQSRLDANKDGYIYQLYRVRGDRIEVYSMACADLTDKEIARTKITRSEGNTECTVTRKEDLARALRILSKRVKSETYWTVEPAPPAAATAPAPPAEPQPAPAPPQ